MRATAFGRALRGGVALAALSAFVVACASASGHSGGPTSTAPAPSGWATQILDAHNQHREAHCAPALAWSSELASTAQAWADHLAAGGCKLEHSQTDFGENLAAGTRGAMSATKAVELWYGEKPNYRGDFSMQSGHFSQLVWKGSARVGCGTASCANMDVWVCNYDPPGNVMGEFKANVSASACR